MRRAVVARCSPSSWKINDIEIGASPTLEAVRPLLNYQREESFPDRLRSAGLSKPNGSIEPIRGKRWCASANTHSGWAAYTGSLHRDL